MFHYYADTIDHVLYPQDKYKSVADRRNVAAGAGGDSGEPQGRAAVGKRKKEGIYAEDWISAAALEHIGDESKKIDPRAASTRRDREFAKVKGYDERNRMVLKFDTQDGRRVILTGLDENQDSLYIVLDKADRTYALSQSTLSAGKY